MQWHSLNDFLAMGGYGLYVWGSFGVSALALAAECWLIHRRRLGILASLRAERGEALPVSFPQERPAA